jgi:hypothetical protein
MCSTPELLPLSVRCRFGVISIRGWCGLCSAGAGTTNWLAEVGALIHVRRYSGGGDDGNGETGRGVEAPGDGNPGLTEPGRYADTGVMLNEARGMDPLLLPPEPWEANDVTRECCGK